MAKTKVSTHKRRARKSKVVYYGSEPFSGEWDVQGRQYNFMVDDMEVVVYEDTVEDMIYVDWDGQEDWRGYGAEGLKEFKQRYPELWEKMR